VFAGHAVETINAKAFKGNGKQLELGVRPEFVSLAATGIPVKIVKVADAGRYRVVEARQDDSTIRLLVPEGEDIPSGSAHVKFDAAHTQIYEDGWMVS
jgi:glycerol transport system ATP-binding protein